MHTDVSSPLSTPKVSFSIRLATPEDAPRLLEIYAPYVTDTAITFEYDIPSLEEFRSRIINTLSKYPYLVAENEGRILGYAYAGVFKARAAYNHCVETSIYVDMSEHKKGIGSALYAELEKRLLAQGILNSNACITWNEMEDEYLTHQSPEFHAKHGYVRVAHFHKCGYKFGRWYDMIWMEKLIGEHPTA